MWQCSHQHENRDSAKFCGKCGEPRVVRVPCARCGSILEPEDIFCTACGHPREAVEQAPPLPPPVREPEPAPAPRVQPAPAPVPPPVEAKPPAEPEAAPVPEAEPPDAEPPEAEPKEEPVTFSFGGAVIEMKESPEAAKSTGPIRRRPPAEGVSPMQSAILSFIVIVVLFGLALYFITR